MKNKSPLPTYIAYEVEFYRDKDLVEQAIKYVPESEYFEDNHNLIELAALNTKDSRQTETAGLLLSKFVYSQWPEFDLKGEKAEVYAKNYFKYRLQQYIDHSCKPYDLCRMVSPIEQLYDFPVWLGNMYNACDWIEPETNSEDCPLLLSEVERTKKL